MNRSSLRRHIDQLCEQHDIGWLTGKPRYGAVALPDWQIRTPPVSGVQSYYIALHEIGHLVLGHCHQRGHILETEAEAWRWALANALVPPNVPTKRWISAALEGYWLWAQTDGRCTPRSRYAPDMLPLWREMRAVTALL